MANNMLDLNMQLLVVASLLNSCVASTLRALMISNRAQHRCTFSNEEQDDDDDLLFLKQHEPKTKRQKMASNAAPVANNTISSATLEYMEIITRLWCPYFLNEQGKNQGSNSTITLLKQFHLMALHQLVKSDEYSQCVMKLNRQHQLIGFADDCDDLKQQYYYTMAMYQSSSGSCNKITAIENLYNSICNSNNSMQYKYECAYLLYKLGFYDKALLLFEQCNNNGMATTNMIAITRVLQASTIGDNSNNSLGTSAQLLVQAIAKQKTINNNQLLQLIIANYNLAQLCSLLNKYSAEINIYKPILVQVNKMQQCLTPSKPLVLYRLAMAAKNNQDYLLAKLTFAELLPLLMSNNINNTASIDTLRVYMEYIHVLLSTSSVDNTDSLETALNLCSHALNACKSEALSLSSSLAIIELLLYKLDAMIGLELEPIECISVVESVFDMISQCAKQQQANNSEEHGLLEEYKALAHNNKGILYLMQHETLKAYQEFNNAHMCNPLLSAPLFNRTLLVLTSSSFSSKQQQQQACVAWLTHRGIPTASLFDSGVMNHHHQHVITPSSSSSSSLFIANLVQQFQQKLHSLMQQHKQQFESHVSGQVSTEQMLLLDMEVLNVCSSLSLNV